MRGNEIIHIDIFSLSHFNSRLCMRGNLYNFASQKHNQYFNSRLCMRGNQAAAVVRVPLSANFNSRLCMRGNNVPKDTIERAKNFNSRLCMRGNITGQKCSLVTHKFQFTPLHERQRQQRAD